MKRTRIISAALSFIIFAQFFLLSLSADGFDNVDKIDGVSHSLSVDKASDGVTEEDLIEAYDTFVEYTEENYFPGIMGLESFISEYYCLDCNGIDEYLELLYNTIESAIEAELSIIGGDEVSDLFEIDDSDDSQEYADFQEAEVAEPNISDENYREGLGYSDEILDAYEKTVALLEAENILVEVCIEDFEANFYNSDSRDLTEYCEKIINDAREHEKNRAPRDEAITYSSGSSGEKEYYYDIGLSPSVKPDYSKYNIVQLAQKGDILFDGKGSGGVFGHVGLVEGVFYSNEMRCYYVRVIESVQYGVTRGLWDACRTDERNSYLYKVFTATPEQKTAAVNFCISQLGKGWFLNLEHGYSPDTLVWMCSQLVWASYKNQGVDIELDGHCGGEPGVTPHDITKNSTSTTEVDIRCSLNTVRDGTYYLTNLKSGKRLDIRGGTAAQSASVQQYDVGDYAEQKWQIRYSGSGRYYTISSDITDNGTFYLDVSKPYSGAHAKVKLWNEYTRPEEKWFIQKDINNTYRFINGYSGLCMDIMGGSTENRADVQVYPYIGANDQRWMLSRCGEKILDNGVYYITNQKSNMRLDIRGSVPQKSAQIQQYTAGNYPEQKWVLQWCPEWSCYYIKSHIVSNGTFYLDVASPESGNHAKVKLWDKCTLPEERWSIFLVRSDTYLFINGYDNMCMDIMGGSTENRADVQVFPYVGSSDQHWKIEAVS